MNIGILIYRNTNLSILYPIIQNLNKSNNVLLIVKNKRFNFIYKFLKNLKIIGVRKEYEYFTSKKYIKNNIPNTKFIYYNDESELVKILQNSNIKKLISVEPYFAYFKLNYSFFKFYVVEWGLDTYLYFVLRSDSDIKVCDFIFASTENYQNIGIKALYDYSKKKWGKYNKKYKNLINSKSIFTNNLWLDIIYEKEIVNKFQEKLNLPKGNLYLYFQPINEARMDDLKGEALDKFKKYFYYKQKEVLKEIYKYCEKNNYKLILKIRAKDKIFNYYKKYSHFFFSNDRGIVNLTNILISLSDVCVINKSNSMHQIVSKNKKFILYDFIDKNMIKENDDNRYYQYFSEIYHNKFIIKPCMPNEILQNLNIILTSKTEIDLDNYKNFLYINNENTNSALKIINESLT